MGNKLPVPRDTLKEVIESGDQIATPTFKAAIQEVEEKRREYAVFIAKMGEKKRHRIEELRSRIDQLNQEIIQAKSQSLEKFKENLESYRGAAKNSVDMTAYEFLLDSEVKSDVVQHFGERIIKASDFLSFVSDYIYDGIKDISIFSDVGKWYLQESKSPVAVFFQTRLSLLFKDLYAILKNQARVSDRYQIPFRFDKSIEIFNRRSAYSLDKIVYFDVLSKSSYCNAENFASLFGVLIDLSNDGPLDENLSLDQIFQRIKENLKYLEIDSSSKMRRIESIFEDISAFIFDIKLPFSEIDLAKSEELDLAFLYVFESFIKQLDLHEVDLKVEELKNKKAELCDLQDNEPLSYRDVFSDIKIYLPNLSSLPQFSNMLLKHAKNAVLDNVHGFNEKSPSAVKSELEFLRSFFNLGQVINREVKKVGKNTVSRMFTKLAAKRRKSKDIAKYIQNFYLDMLTSYELFQAGQSLFKKTKLDSDRKAGEALVIYANMLLEGLEREAIYAEVALNTANIGLLKRPTLDSFDYGSPNSIQALSRYIEEQEAMYLLNSNKSGELNELAEFKQRLDEEESVGALEF